MKVVIAGYEGSKKAIPPCAHLLEKYLKGDFDVHFVNFGANNKEDFCNQLATYLGFLEDEFIVLGVDDFFLSKPINLKMYDIILELMTGNHEIVCGKLCPSLFHPPSSYLKLSKDVFMLNQNAEWSAVIQFTLWRRAALVELLKQAKDPWEFEIEGSKRLNATDKKVIGTFTPALVYPDRSAMSRTQPGKISVLGNPKEDVEEMISKGLLDRKDLIMGLWPGKTMEYDEYKDKPYDCLIGHDESIYGRKLLELCLEP